MKRGRRRALSLGSVALMILVTTLSIPVSEAMWSKILRIHGRVNAAQLTTGTIGFWSNWDRHQTYTELEIETWLVVIDGASGWLGPVTVEEMVLHFEAALGGGASMESRFLAHYLATRLNEQAGILSGPDTHDVTALDPGNFLGLPDPGQASLEQIISAFEAKYGDSLTDEQYEIMKGIADALNNQDI